MFDESIQSVALGKQLAVASGMMLVMTTVHALGLAGIARALHLRNDHIKELDFNFKSVTIMSEIGLLLLSLHTLEIAISAAVYLVVGAMRGVEEALFCSASTYVTLGLTDDYFPQEWRLLAAFEALIGFLLIGWSTAFIVSKVEKLMPDRRRPLLVTQPMSIPPRNPTALDHRAG